MTESLRKHAPLLSLLHRASPKLRRTLLKQKCNREFVKCISNCCLNLLKGNVPLSRDQLRKLRVKKNVIRKVADSKTTLTTKKKLIQKGGFLSLILPPLIGALGSLFGGLLGSRSS